MLTKILLGIVVTFLMVTTDAFGTEPRQSDKEPTTQESTVTTTPPERVVLPSLRGRGLPIFGEGVATTKPRPVPVKPPVWGSRDYDKRFIESVHPSEMNTPSN